MKYGMPFLKRRPRKSADKFHQFETENWSSAIDLDRHCNSVWDPDKWHLCHAGAEIPICFINGPTEKNKSPDNLPVFVGRHLEYENKKNGHERRYILANDD